jgi:hypothetical protein
MGDLHARFESWREARERARLELAAGLADRLDVERIDDEFGDVTNGDGLARHDGRFKVALAQAALARELRAGDERIAARTAAGAEPEELDELRAERVAIRSARLARLGFASARAFAEALRPGVDYDAWRREARSFLERSDSVPRSAERVPAAASTFAAELPAARMRPALDFALEGMRLELARLPALRVDAEPRAEKRAAAFAGAPRVPDEVWLAFAPVCGAAAWEGLFAAAGEALHLVFTSASLSLEKRVLGDPALGLAFGEVTRALFAEPALGAMLAGVDPAHFAAATQRRRLTELRETAGRVALELQLAELPPGAAAPELGEPGILASVGPALSSVDRLRAACLGTGLAGALRARFGREWWKTRAAGELLKELWNTGATYAPEALARELSLPELGAEALLEAELAR